MDIERLKRKEDEIYPCSKKAMLVYVALLINPYLSNPKIIAFT